MLVSPPLENQLAGDPEQKRQQGSAIRIVRLGLAPQREKALLHDVLGAVR